MDLSRAFALTLPIEHVPGSRSGFAALAAADFGLGANSCALLSEFLLAGADFGNERISEYEPLFPGAGSSGFGLDSSYLGSRKEGIWELFTPQVHGAFSDYCKALANMASVLGFGGDAVRLIQVFNGAALNGHPHHDGVGLEPGLVKLSVRFSLSFVESTAFPVSGFTGPVRLPEKLTSEVEWYLKQGFYSPKPNSTVQVVQAKPGDFAVWDQNQTVPHFAPSGRPRLIASVSEVITRKEAARRFRGVRGVNLVEYSALSIPNNWSSRQVIGKAACL